MPDKIVRKTNEIIRCHRDKRMTNINSLLFIKIHLCVSWEDSKITRQKIRIFPNNFTKYS